VSIRPPTELSVVSFQFSVNPLHTAKTL